MNMNFRNVFIYLIIALCCKMNIYSQQISSEKAADITAKFLKSHNLQANAQLVTCVMLESKIAAWIFNIHPEGFIIISADKKCVPVIAYSFTCGFEPGQTVWQIVLQYISNTVKLYQDNFSILEPGVSLDWRTFDENISDNRFEQWPPPGTTTTGGWLETNWTQSAPYNMMCPMDLNSGNRSIAGCPAVAMAQIVNFNKETNGVQFDDGDDYYHSFGAGNQYWIDDDHVARDFPAFPELNLFMTALQDKYNKNEPPTSEQVTALNFACGVACKQVYSSSISGTYGIEQAYNAFVRFEFDSVKLIYDTDSSLNRKLADNMKNAMPAQLGLVNPEGTAGHNLVVDGYNTDEFYHFNFGWGGSANGWYTMPPTNIPYNLTIIEGLIIDINKENIHVGFDYLSQPENRLILYPNPAGDYIKIIGINPGELSHLRIFDLKGILVFNTTSAIYSDEELIIDISTINPGIYFIQVTDRNGIVTHCNLMVR